MKNVEEIARTVEKDLLDRKFIVKQNYIDEEKNQEYYLISTPDALKQQYIFIIVSGHPEIAGVWSHTLLSQGKIEESSMESYFKRFQDEGWGLIALNPHLIEDDIVGTNYIKQLNKVIKEVSAESSVGFIGFSMGPRIVYDFLSEHKNLIEKVISIAQIDPVIQSVGWDKDFIKILESKTILFASSTDQYRFGMVASALLEMSSIPVEGIHGEMPYNCLEKIIEFFKSQISNKKS
jgi:hypothetical protein